jgi:hypothetical protein
MDQDVQTTEVVNVGVADGGQATGSTRARSVAVATMITLVELGWLAVLAYFVFRFGL